jgi:HPr kinase/phosphorylase
MLHEAPSGPGAVGQAMRTLLHASCVDLSGTGVVLVGPSGSGKSDLALRLIDGGARLIADDLVVIERTGDQLTARSPEAIAGLIEVRGLGIRRLPHEPVAAVGLVVDLGLPHADRMPQDASLTADIAGVTLPRLAVAAGEDPLYLLVAALRTDSRT